MKKSNEKMKRSSATNLNLANSGAKAVIFARVSSVERKDRKNTAPVKDLKL